MQDICIHRALTVPSTIVFSEYVLIFVVFCSYLLLFVAKVCPAGNHKASSSFLKELFQDKSRLTLFVRNLKKFQC